MKFLKRHSSNKRMLTGKGVIYDQYENINIESVGSMQVPKGTTAQQPGVLSATVAAATTGAMRYNTDNSYFEGVNAGTTFEAFATQNFSTAIAVALG